MKTKPLTFIRNEQETLAQRLERAASSFKTAPEIVLGDMSVELESERGFSLPLHPTFAPDRVMDDMSIEREQGTWLQERTAPTLYPAPAPNPIPAPRIKK